MADAGDLKSPGLKNRAGSSPASGTTFVGILWSESIFPTTSRAKRKINDCWMPETDDASGQSHSRAGCPFTACLPSGLSIASKHEALD